MTSKVVIADGLDDPPLDQQSFYTPTGNYFIVGARAAGVMSTPDLHVVSTVGAEDVMISSATARSRTWSCSPTTTS